jgi:hypothetical protein
VKKISAREEIIKRLKPHPMESGWAMDFPWLYYLKFNLFGGGSITVVFPWCAKEFSFDGLVLERSVEVFKTENVSDAVCNYLLEKTADALRDAISEISDEICLENIFSLLQQKSAQLH